ncbi:unnamed protein product, partial [Didymodactylos carnosus]
VVEGGGKDYVAPFNDQINTTVGHLINTDSTTASQYQSMTINDNNTTELKIILCCICEQSNLFQFKDLVQCGGFQYLNQILNDISETLVDIINDKQHTFPEFIQGFLTPIMYLLKRQPNLDDFLNTLKFKYVEMQQRMNDQSKETINLSLRMLLHVLFMNSDLFLRRILMSLLSKRNPVPFISPNIVHGNKNEQYEFVLD